MSNDVCDIEVTPDEILSTARKMQALHEERDAQSIDVHTTAVTLAQEYPDDIDRAELFCGGCKVLQNR